jgi:hypothetical protein
MKVHSVYYMKQILRTFGGSTVVFEGSARAAATPISYYGLRHAPFK